MLKESEVKDMLADYRNLLEKMDKTPGISLTQEQRANLVNRIDALERVIEE